MLGGRNVDLRNSAHDGAATSTCGFQRIGFGASQRAGKWWQEPARGAPLRARSADSNTCRWNQITVSARPIWDKPWKRNARPLVRGNADPRPIVAFIAEKSSSGRGASVGKKAKKWTPTAP